MKTNTIILFCCFLLSSCDSETAFDCIKKPGSTVTQFVETSMFDTVILKDNIDLVVSNGDTSVFVESGKNLLPKIRFETVNNILTISNDNTCNWSRKYTAATVYLSHPDLKEIQLLGYGNLTAIDTLIFNYLRIISLDSSSDVDLTLSGNKLYISSNNISNFNLDGEVWELNAGFYYGDGILEARNLLVDYAIITHTGTNTMRIKPLSRLEGTINNIGSIEIYAAPAEIEIKLNGSGRIIKKY